MMSNKFNADTLKSMNSIPPAIKHLFIFVMIGFFFCSVIQTTTYFEIIAEASYEISKNNPSESFTKPGRIFLVTMGMNPTESKGGGEKAWSEITGHETNTVEEMDEKSYKFAVRDSQKFTVEGRDEWQENFGPLHEPAHTTWENNRYLITNPKCYNNYGDDEEQTSVKRRCEMKDLNDFGSVEIKLDIDPKIEKTTDKGNHFGFMLNPEFGTYGGKQTRFKEKLLDNRRVGLGMFLVVFPEPGFNLTKIEIQDMENENTFITFKHNITNPTCTSDSCALNFSNDFTSKDCHEKNFDTYFYDTNYKQGWIGGATTRKTITVAPRVYRTESKFVEWCAENPVNRSSPFRFDKIPDTQKINLDSNKTMPVLSISENSAYIGKECVGCTDYGVQGSGKEINLWQEVWKYLNDTSLEGYKYDDGTSNSDRIFDDYNGYNSIYKALHGGDLTNANATQIQPLVLSGNTPILNPEVARKNQPVMLALLGAHEGGDNWLYDCCMGHKGNFLDVYEVHNSEYKIKITFEEYGLQVKVITTPINNKAASVFALEQSFNLNKDHVAYGETISPTFGSTGDTPYCINSATYDTWILMKERKEVLTNQQALDDVIPLGQSVTKELNNITTNHDFSIDIFEPKFSVTVQNEDDQPGEAYMATGSEPDNDPSNVERYILKNDWDLKENSILNKKIPQKTTRDLNPTLALKDSKSCGFEGYYQPIYVKANTDLYYYFDSFETTKAEIYVKNETGTYVPYESNKDLVKFKTTPFVAYAKVTNRNDANVTVIFKQYPQITVAALVGDGLSGKYELVDRALTQSKDIDLNDCKKDRFFSKDNNTYTIAPPPPSSTCDSISFRITKNLKRLLLTYEELNGFKLPQGIFVNNDQTLTDTLSELKLDLDNHMIDTATRENMQLEVLPTNNIPIEITKTTASGNTFKAKLMRCNNTDPLEDAVNCNFEGLDPFDYNPHYRLTIPRIGDTTFMYIQLVPNILNFYATPFQSFLANGDELNSGLLNSDLYFRAPELPLKVYLYNDVSGKNLLNDFSEGLNNKKVTLNINIKGQTDRETYYISDIFEHKLDDDSDIFVKRTNSYYRDLTGEKERFLLLEPYVSEPISRDTNFIFVLDTYKQLSYRFTDENYCYNTLVMGGMALSYSELAAPFPSTGASYKNVNCGSTGSLNYSELKANRIFTTPTQETSVGFRRFDTAKLSIIPEPGFYIKAVYLSRGTPPEDWEQTRESVLSTLPDTPDMLSSKDLIITWDQESTEDGAQIVTDNVYIEIDFEKKPAFKGFTPFMF